jgi:hypothetical protein
MAACESAARHTIPKWPRTNPVGLKPDETQNPGRGSGACPARHPIPEMAATHPGDALPIAAVAYRRCGVYRGGGRVNLIVAPAAPGNSAGREETGLRQKDDGGEVKPGGGGDALRPRPKKVLL